MPLVFDERGLLPPGIHDATLDEIDRHFGRFQKTDRRTTFIGKLKAYVKEVKSTGWQCEIIVDGSFVMPMVDEPNDIDIILVLPADWDLTRVLRPFEYNVVDKAFTKKEYRIEVFAAPAGSELETRIRHLFEQVRSEWCQRFGWPEGTVKGAVRIVE
jgi:uncharacterized protein DUF6932